MFAVSGRDRKVVYHRGRSLASPFFYFTCIVFNKVIANLEMVLSRKGLDPRRASLSSRFSSVLS